MVMEAEKSHSLPSANWTNKKGCVKKLVYESKG